MNVRTTLTIVGACLLLGACQGATEEKSVEVPTETPEPAAEPEPAEEVPPTAEAVPTEPTADDVPIPEDFAEEAAKDITSDNYTDQLAAMEKELAD